MIGDHNKLDNLRIPARRERPFGAALPALGALAIIFGAAMAFASPASAALVTYTASGSSITGTLGGTGFTDASWTITGAADSGSVQTGVIPGVGSAFVYNFVNPSITVTDATNTWTAELLDVGGVNWGVTSIDYSTFADPFSVSGFATFTSGQPLAGFAARTGPPQTSDLVTSVVIVGQQVDLSDETFSTSDGDLVITSVNNGAASFSVAAAPTPGTPALLALGTLLGWRFTRASRYRDNLSR